jgi:hypothetical protein
VFDENLNRSLGSWNAFRSNFSQDGERQVQGDVDVVALGDVGLSEQMHKCILGGVWFEELKFNKHCSTFVLFDKKFSILD